MMAGWGGILEEEEGVQVNRGVMEEETILRRVQALVEEEEWAVVVVVEWEGVVEQLYA